MREIRAYSSDLVTTRGLVTPDLAFNRTVHHVSQIFSLLLPRYYILDGSSLVQINFGPRGSEPSYQQVLGSTSSYVDPFDFDAFQRASSDRREQIVLAYLESMLAEIAEHAGTDAVPIHETVNAVRKCGFSFEIEAPKLRKALPGRWGSVRVSRRLAFSLPEAWFARIVGMNGSIRSENLMREPAPLNLSGHFHKAEIVGGSYVVSDKFGKESYRLPLAVA